MIAGWTMQDLYRQQEWQSQVALIEMRAQEHALLPPPTRPLTKCDGNHGGPRCADPECWNDDSLNAN